jgi:hypothetical protein
MVDGFAAVTVKHPEHTPVPSSVVTRASHVPIAAALPPDPVARLNVAVAVVPETLPVTAVPVISACPALWRTAPVGAVMPVPVNVSEIPVLVFSPVGGVTDTTVGAAAMAGVAAIATTIAANVTVTIPLRIPRFIAAPPPPTAGMQTCNST